MMFMSFFWSVSLLVFLGILSIWSIETEGTSLTTNIVIASDDSSHCQADLCVSRFSPGNTVTELPFVKNDLPSFQIHHHQIGEDDNLLGNNKLDLLVVPFYENNKTVNAEEKKKEEKSVTALRLLQSISSITPEIDNALKNLLEDDTITFSGKANENIVTRLFQPKEIRSLCIHGLGKDTSSSSSSSLQSVGKSIADIALKNNAKTIGIVLPFHKQNDPEMIQQLLLGLYEGSYKDFRFKLETDSIREEKSKGIKEIHFFFSSKMSSFERFVEAERKAASIAAGVQFARDLVGAPANCKTPLSIAEEAKKIAKMPNMKLTILDQKECEELGMGGYLGVQKGSKFPPQFIHLQYLKSSHNQEEDGNNNQNNNEQKKKIRKIALIGKGLTFDSGGYNLKVAGGKIELMKFDMGGCAAVLGTALSIAQLQPEDIEVHFITALVENMISAEAMKPGDILKTSNGKTIEVINTDAEGRLTLADALVYAEKLNVDAIIDLATLTGACIIGLGNKIAGLYSSTRSLETQLVQSSKATDDKVWPLPLESSYIESVKSNLADVKNLASLNGGGSITAALFLQEFVTEKTPWAHIDMAGPVWDDKNNGPTGFGVKLLVDFLLRVKDPEAVNSFKD